jgi:uncharacterized protein YdiU (UPF0061 family)
VSVAALSIAVLRRFTPRAAPSTPLALHAMATAGSPAPVTGGTLAAFGAHADPSWITRLEADPDQDRFAPNKSSRKVRSGHYVLVDPTPLPDPELITYSPEMAAELGLAPDACTGPEVLRFLSGDLSAAPWARGRTWATPYALSIYGQEQYHNCPFGTGEGYGDGRAISVAEVRLKDGRRWELQLKGGGTTPFCRGGDGRAVLRSSVREFLASEAMHHLGVPTTRALTLIKSRSETTQRPWYTNGPKPPLPSLDDPRLAGYTPDLRKALLEQLKDKYRSPDRTITETCAITCRVAPSFLRIGHVELFARRAAGPRAKPVGPERDRALAQLRAILEHALFREYPECAMAGEDLEPRVLCLLEGFSRRLAALTADWVRVGYCQGNFNADNCLVGGRTMDYGPFGFIQRFEPLWNMWQMGGEHFGFLNQPAAGYKNFASFVTAVLPVLSPSGVAAAERIQREHLERATAALDDVWRRKLGLAAWDPPAEALLQRLLILMTDSEADYTFLWRQLADLPATGRTGEEPAASLVADLGDVFYAPLSAAGAADWGAWLRDWLRLLKAQGRIDGAAVAEDMRRTSPKYIPREWMLVDCYTAGTTEAVEELLEVFRDPYGLNPASERFEARFYRKAPPETYVGAGIGGCTFMSCSS